MHDYSEQKVHLTMCCVGGMLGGYTIVRFANVMATAITTNMNVMLVELLRMNLPQFLLRFGVVALYLLGLALPVICEYRLHWSRHLFCLAATAVLVVVTPLLPDSWPNLARMYPVFLACGMLYNSFMGYGGMGVAPVFSTNNSRQTVSRYLAYHYTKDPESLRTARIYLSCILSFLLGTVFAYACVRLLGAYGIWPALVLLALAFYFERTKGKTA